MAKRRLASGFVSVRRIANTMIRKRLAGIAYRSRRRFSYADKHLPKFQRRLPVGRIVIDLSITLRITNDISLLRVEHS